MEQQIQPVQVPRWPSNCASGIKTKLKDFSGERLKKKKIQWGQLIFHRGPKQKLCLKYAEIPSNMLLL